MVIKICCICECEDAKYKCPKCKQLYCSVVCCNKHKECCNINVESESYYTDQSSLDKTNEKYDFPTEDTVPIEKLEQLRYNKELKNCLKNSQVRDIIKSVLKNTDPTNAIAEAMTEPVFLELVDACLKIVEPSDEEKPC